MEAGSDGQGEALSWLDEDLCASLVFGRFDLTEDKIDSAGIVIDDAFLVAEGVDQGFAAAGAVINVEEFRSVTGDRDFNASLRAVLASFFIFVSIQWFRPSMVFRLGVTYFGSQRRTGAKEALDVTLDKVSGGMGEKGEDGLAVGVVHYRTRLIPLMMRQA